MCHLILGDAMTKSGKSKIMSLVAPPCGCVCLFKHHFNAVKTPFKRYFNRITLSINLLCLGMKVLGKIRYAMLLSNPDERYICIIITKQQE